MKKSTKAALLSLLVLPGAGHIFLKKYVAAVFFVGAAVVPLYILISYAIERALLISDKILRGEVQLDSYAILTMVRDQGVGHEVQMIEMATVVLIVVWLLAIADSYRVGRMQDVIANEM